MLAGAETPARVLHFYVASFSALVDQCAGMLQVLWASDDDLAAGLEALAGAKQAYQLRSRVVHSHWWQGVEDPNDLATSQVKRKGPVTEPINFEELAYGVEQLAAATIRCQALMDLVVRSQLSPETRAATPEITDRRQVLRGEFDVVGLGPFYRLRDM